MSLLTSKNVCGCFACIYVCVSQAYSTEEGVALQLVVNHLVLGLKPESSGRAASALNPWGIYLSSLEQTFIRGMGN